jgi:hypothetical protein
MGIQGCSRVAAPQPIREKRLIPPKRLIKIALKKLSSLIDCRRTQKIIPFASSARRTGASFPDFRAVQEALIIRTMHKNQSRRRRRQG